VTSGGNDFHYNQLIKFRVVSAVKVNFIPTSLKFSMQHRASFRHRMDDPRVTVESAVTENEDDELVSYDAVVFCD